ncbi:MAG: type II toxin-antitoxin system VapC family toxin [Chloroflexi bacterium]|nr:type II toxin-antitoxin system VapC family toxin [Chloroflexota bacterium]
MIYLDTHVVVWLYAGLLEKFNQQVGEALNDQEVYISPVVRLELRYLYEIERITVDADAIVTDLSSRIGLNVCGKDYNAIVTQAMEVTWTRDPFDRLIVAHAALHDDILISKDQNILEHYAYALW